MKKMYTDRYVVAYPKGVVVLVEAVVHQSY